MQLPSISETPPVPRLFRRVDLAARGTMAGGNVWHNGR